MHILHVIDGLAIGGAERMLVDIANATVQDDHRVSVCITRTQTELAAELDSRIEQIVLNRTRTFDFAAFRRFNAFVAQNKVTVIHAHGRSTFSFVAFSRIFSLRKVPIILHDHYGNIEIDSSIPAWFRYWGWREIAAYIGVYQKLGDWAVAAGIPKERVFVVGNGINLRRIAARYASKLREQFGIEPSTPVGVVVGGLRREKGIDLLIDSLTVCDQLDYKILIIGGERDAVYVRECKDLAEQRGIAGKLIFVGERKDVPEIIASADFGLMPSRSESGPLVLIEFMAAGLPIVSFRIGDVAQAAAAYGIQGFVEPNDTAAFATQFAKLLSSPRGEWQKRGRFGQEVAHQQFSIEAKMPQFYEVYRRVQEYK